MNGGPGGGSGGPEGYPDGGDSPGGDLARVVGQPLPGSGGTVRALSGRELFEETQRFAEEYEKEQQNTQRQTSAKAETAGMLAGGLGVKDIHGMTPTQQRFVEAAYQRRAEGATTGHNRGKRGPGFFSLDTSGRKPEQG